MRKKLDRIDWKGLEGLLEFPPAPQPPADPTLRACINVAAWTQPDFLGTLLFTMLYGSSLEEQTDAEDQLRGEIQTRKGEL